MDTVAQHIDGLLIESAWMDPDGTGQRQWNIVRGLGTDQCLCTTSELRALLRTRGLDIANLALTATPSRRGQPSIPVAAARRVAADPEDAEDTEDVDDECE